MAKVVKNLSKIQVNKGETSYELLLPKTDASGTLENVAYTNLTNSFVEPQELVLKTTSDYEFSELKGKSSKYDRVTSTYDSGTNSSLLVTSLVDKNNKIVADSTLQVTSGIASAMFEVPNQDGSSVAQLGIKFNTATNKFDSFAPNTSTNSADNAIVTKKYLEEQLEGYVSSGEAVNVETATNDTKGIVLLSDAPGDADSINGGTAVTPKALKNVSDSVDKLIKTIDKELGVDVSDPEYNPEDSGSSSNTGATENTKGTIYLSDALDRSDLTASSGSTAATPKAVNDLQIQIGNLTELNTTAKENLVAAINEVKSTGGSSSGGSGSEILPPGDTSEILPPTISVLGAPSNVGKAPTVTCSEFTVVGSKQDTHDKTDWVITTVGDTGSVVYESRNDSTNLTKIKIPEGKLQASTTYVINVRYHGTSLGWSNWSNSTFATLSKFTNTNYIGVPGTANFGVGLADEKDYTSLGLTPCENCETPNHFQYGLYTKTIQVQTPNDTGLGSITTPCYFKFIPKFYIKYLQGINGVNLTSEELDATLPYVDVTKEQMQEAQRRSPKNAMVVASADKFINKDEAQLQGFILPRGFIDGDVEKNGFFILNTVVSGTGDGAKLTSLSFGVSSISVASTLVPLALYNSSSVDSHLISNMKGNTYDAVSISKLVGDEFNCCSIFAWSIISILSLIQGQYTTSTEDCAWYNSGLTNSFPKGINSNRKDVNNSSVTATVGSDSKQTGKPNTIVNTEYTKTTHNGSITGITNVNGWMHQWCTGFGYQNSNYKYLGTSHKISEITKDNVASIYDIPLGTKLESAGFATSSTKWGSSTSSSFSREFTGNKWAMNGVYSYANDSSGTNEFGLDYHYWGAGSGIYVGGSWSDGSDAGVFRRGYSNWGNSNGGFGFRIIAYPV